jgi:hypothetical protein
VGRDIGDETVRGLAVLLWTGRPLWREILTRAPIKVASWFVLNFLLPPRKLHRLAHALWEKWPLQQLRTARVRRPLTPASYKP